MSEPAILTWRQAIIYALLAAFGAVATKLIDLIRGRRQDIASVHKTRAEADEMDFNVEMSAAQMLRGMNLDIISLEREKAQLKQENEAYEIQLRRTKALLKLNNINYDD